MGEGFSFSLLLFIKTLIKSTCEITYAHVTYEVMSHRIFKVTCLTLYIKSVAEPRSLSSNISVLLNKRSFYINMVSVETARKDDHPKRQEL